MRGYKLTGRGWALVLVVAALLFVGTYALVTSAFGGEPSENTPSDDPHLADPTVTAEPTPTEEPTPSVLDTPTPTEEPTPSAPDESPDDPLPTDTTPVPPPSAPPSEPQVKPSPTTAASSPSPATPKPAQTPKDPAESPSLPSWVDGKAAIMFDFDSYDRYDRDLAVEDLTELLPDVSELEGYVVVISAYTAQDETVEDLAQKRADEIYDILTGELELPDSMIRILAASDSGGKERYRQRVDVYFLYVGIK